MKPREAKEIERELDTLGEWLPLIEGSALPMPEERVDGGEGRNGRPDGVDRASREYSRAVRALRTLDRVDARSAALLWYAYVATGPDTREAYNAGKVRVHLGDHTYDVRAPGGWPGRVAMVFASEERREEVLLWRERERRNAALRIVGDGLLADALTAYAAARKTSGVDNVQRLDLPRLRAALSAAGERADRDLVVLTRARENSKTRKAKRS